MKRKMQRMKTLLLCVLCALLLCGCTADEKKAEGGPAPLPKTTFCFDNGLRFGMSLEEVTRLQGRERDGAPIVPNKSLQSYAWKKVALGEHTSVQQQCIFDSRGLIMVVYDFALSPTAEEMRSALNSRYGEAQPLQAKRLLEIYTAMGSRGLTEDRFSGLAQWRVNGDTLIMMGSTARGSFELYCLPEALSLQELTR